MMLARDIHQRLQMLIAQMRQQDTLPRGDAPDREWKFTGRPRSLACAGCQGTPRCALVHRSETVCLCAFCERAANVLANPAYSAEHRREALGWIESARARYAP